MDRLTNGAGREVVALLQRRYPGITSFRDHRFEQDEVAYKKATAAKAQEALAKGKLRKQIDAGQFDAVIETLDEIGKDNNLLWRAMPLRGDLGILYAPELDKAGFCEAVFDLLYGEGDFGRTICLAVQGGLDTDCNGATAGSIAGVMLGAAALPAKWIGPLHNRVLSMVAGFTDSRLSDLADRTVRQQRIVARHFGA